jgi:hypothetical protein
MLLQLFRRTKIALDVGTQQNVQNLKGAGFMQVLMSSQWWLCWQHRLLETVEVLTMVVMLATQITGNC